MRSPAHRLVWTGALLALAIAPAVGVGGDGAVALQTADPACPDGSGDVYVDCGNGTVTDTRTGLVWLKDAGCYGTEKWGDATRFLAGLSDLPESLNEDCATVQDPSDTCDCGLSDGSSPGDWRLPSIDEWHEMVAPAVALGCLGDDGPAIVSDDGLGCWSETDSFTGIQPFPYWSATLDPADWRDGFAQDLGDGQVKRRKIPVWGLYVWPVRGGQ
jgi:hypothetical protein